MKRREFLQLTAAGTGLALGDVMNGPLLAAESPAGKPANGPLRRHPDNPAYFTDGTGRAVLLTGSHTWNNLLDMGTTDPLPKFDFDAYLKFLNRYGHNFIRLWTWEVLTWDVTKMRQSVRKVVNHVEPAVWARTGSGAALDGKPKFDLTKFNPAYFDRLRTRVRAAAQQGIYVSIMLFEGWALQFAPNAWRGHPMNPANNVNGIDGDVNRDGSGVEVHELRNPAVTRLQESYVRHVIDTVNDLDNVLYEISNENHPASTPWQYHMIRFIKQYEASKPKQHPVGMTFQYKGGSNKTLFDSPADWISPNPEGGYRDNPPPADGKKVVLADTDHLWGIGGNQAWAWKSFLRGLNPLFMDTYDGSVLGHAFEKRWQPIRRSLGQIRRWSERVDLAQMRPLSHLASTRYCLAKPGTEYLVFLPGGGSTSVDLTAVGGPLEAIWFDPQTGAESKVGTVAGGKRVEFQSDTNTDMVLYVRQNESR